MIIILFVGLDQDFSVKLLRSDEVTENMKKTNEKKINTFFSVGEYLILATFAHCRVLAGYPMEHRIAITLTKVI